MQLDEIVTRIEATFGQTGGLPEGVYSEEDLDAMRRIFTRDSYQDFLQDQTSRQIIRDYLTNAVVLGYLDVSDLGQFAPLVQTPQARSVLSLHMLMLSVEDAASLLAEEFPLELTRLDVEPDPSPHIQLVRK